MHEILGFCWEKSTWRIDAMFFLPLPFVLFWTANTILHIHETKQLLPSVHFASVFYSSCREMWRHPRTDETLKMETLLETWQVAEVCEMGSIDWETHRHALVQFSISQSLIDPVITFLSHSYILWLSFHSPSPAKFPFFPHFHCSHLPNLHYFTRPFSTFPASLRFYFQNAITFLQPLSFLSFPWPFLWFPPPGSLFSALL